MKIPVLKKGDKYYVQLPPEVEISDSLELFSLKDGYYLLTTGLNSKSKSEQKPKEKKPITLEDELAVISRLLSIKFAERTPANVARLLNPTEKEIFDSLIKKKHIWIYKGKKYKEKGVYNISDKLFNLWKENRSKSTNTSQPGSSFFSTLQKDGFMIVSNMNDAKRFSEELKQRMALGKVLGVRSFDGKYYVATSNYYSRLRKSIMEKVNDSMSLDAISELCNAPTDACDVVLRLMSEQGEVVEKRRDVFSLVD